MYICVLCTVIQSESGTLFWFASKKRIWPQIHIGSDNAAHPVLWVRSLQSSITVH